MNLGFLQQFKKQYSIVGALFSETHRFRKYKLVSVYTILPKKSVKMNCIISTNFMIIIHFLGYIKRKYFRRFFLLKFTANYTA
jgi:hypothetical protein